ncbi:rhodanese family protein [Bradyrhizobium sp. KB893862 SZCCT0404]|uniref:rhodanese family protein n=1 Tax=Bradyrhizobium sp. KB893862 SZCCT0404 TaxID=2807672 RepID=UPI001BA44927|nr:rhodanese family protein [Bradyrhizobium sp. KB893862 SZCCT0404]MBR1179037.1 rhodanese family protein [Bradyrhizobium sp. KB893862 SZCCT0404]
MSLPRISPEKAKDLIEEGAVLVDIREADEHARSRIAAAVHAPLSRLDKVEIAPNAKAVIFHCRSGNRTHSNADRLARSSDCEAYILDGGIDAWRSAGLPVVDNRSQPIEIMRQVQITAGSLVIAGTALGLFAHPAFYALAASVGAGLVFSGVSGSCMMARLLAFAPWNRLAPRAAA